MQRQLWQKGKILRKKLEGWGTVRGQNLRVKLAKIRKNGASERKSGKWQINEVNQKSAKK